MKPSNKNRIPEEQPANTGVWGRLSDAIEKRKRAVAEFLGRTSERLSPNGKKLSLLFFGIVMGGVSLALITAPFRDSPVSAYGFTKELSPPSTTVPIQPSDSIFSQEDYQLLIGFKHTLDSLKQYDPATYHELIKGREGLLDSINFLLRFY